MNSKLSGYCVLFVALAFPIVVCAQSQDIWTLWQQKTIAKIDAATGLWTQYGTGMIDPARPIDPPGIDWTTIAETPDERLFLFRRRPSSVGEIFLYSISANNIAVSAGNITNLQLLGSTGLCGNIDGLTAGPDGNLYFSSYNAGRFVKGTGGQADQCIFNLPAKNGLYRVRLPMSGPSSIEYVGTFAGNLGPGQKNSFYTDLAFDALPLPNGGDLIGEGIDATGTHGLYTIPRNVVLTGMNQTFPYTPFSNVALTVERMDGVAFDPTNGDLFLAGDALGVYRVTRTGANPVVINTTSPVLGWDLANHVRGCSDARPIRIVCVPGTPGDYIFTFEVTNHSGKSMSSISITDPLPATVSPHSQPLSPPLADGDSRLITVTVHGATPGQLVCLNGVMIDKECPGCCKFHVCVAIPECKCIQLVKDEGPKCTGNPDGSFTYTFQLQNLSSQPLGALFIHPPAGVIVTPDYFALSPPVAANGGIDTPHTITVTGAIPGKQICFDLTVLDADLNECCTQKICVDAPRCELPHDHDNTTIQGEPPTGVTPP